MILIQKNQFMIFFFFQKIYLSVRQAKKEGFKRRRTGLVMQLPQQTTQNVLNMWSHKNRWGQVQNPDEPHRRPLENIFPPEPSILSTELHSISCAWFNSLPMVKGGEMLDTQEQRWHEVGRTMAGVFLTGEGRDFWIFFLLLVWFWERSLRGSLTRRCGRGESAVRGRAVGFRVGHREGHWAGHWGRWRQQEGAWHFALAAPVWLQTTQIGSGGRHATIRRHGMKEDAGREARSKKISMTGREGGNGGRRERRWVGNNNQRNDVCGRHLLWRCEK